VVFSSPPSSRLVTGFTAPSYGRDKAREPTALSEHTTAAEAFAEIDRLSAQMVRTGAPSDAIELIVIDGNNAIMRRSRVN